MIILSLMTAGAAKSAGRITKSCTESPRNFPNGIKAVAVMFMPRARNSRIYSCGSHTCGVSGSFEYEFLDAEPLQKWGVDFLKYDYCFRPTNASGHCTSEWEPRWKTAADILFSACSWGVDDTADWIKTTAPTSGVLLQIYLTPGTA